MKTRLVFTATDRPYYFQPVMRSWADVRGVHDWNPTVYLEPTRTWETMAAIAYDELDAAVHLNPSRRGVLDNPWHALNSAFQDAEFVVLAEDDIVVSDDILEYFTWAAHTLRDEHILAICAWSPARTCPPEQTQLILRQQWFNPLVWGTWRDRWTTVLRDTWDHHYSSGTTEAPQSGWDWNINLRVIVAGAWDVVAPLASRTTHIGERGGTHTTPESFPASMAATFTAHRDPAPFAFGRCR